MRKILDGIFIASCYNLNGLFQPPAPPPLPSPQKKAVSEFLQKKTIMFIFSFFQTTLQYLKKRVPFSLWEYEGVLGKAFFLLKSSENLQFSANFMGYSS